MTAQQWTSFCMGLVWEPSAPLPHGVHLGLFATFSLQTMPYRLDESTGLIDYDMMEKTAALFRWAAAAGYTWFDPGCFNMQGSTGHTGGIM